MQHADSIQYEIQHKWAIVIHFADFFSSNAGCVHAVAHSNCFASENEKVLNN